MLGVWARMMSKGNGRSKRYKSVFIIRLVAAGDVVRTTPLLRRP